MDVETFQLFFALLALLALVGAVAVAAVRVAARRHDGAALLVGTLSSARVPLATVVAAVAMVGSLYFSESAHYIPCTLCWYQRIAMYPIAVLGVVAWRRGDDTRFTQGVLAGIGLLISTYHWLLERIPELDTGACSATIPCDIVWFEKFGFVTLPFMAGCGFLAVLALVTLPTFSPSPSE